MSTAGPRVCVAFGLGCPRSEVDTARLIEFFRANGWSICDSIEEADLVLVMTCGFCGRFEDLSFELLEAAERRRRPDSRMIVGGCLAGINPTRLTQAFDAELVAPKDTARFQKLINATVPLANVEDPTAVEPYIDRASHCFTDVERRTHETPVRATFRRIAQSSGLAHRSSDEQRDERQQRPANRICSIRVAQGCLGVCSYCAIRFAAGMLESKPLEKVLAEFDSGLSQGFTRFRLIAGDLGSYGQDIGTNVVELLEGLLSRQEDFRLSLRDFDPKWLINYQTDLTDLFSRDSARIESVLVPIQSGSERILALMRRGHTAQDAQKALGSLRAACPKIPLETHVLIGFPTESEKDFEDTLTFVRTIQFNSVVGYNYEDRPNTDASRMQPKVPWRTIKSRGFRLIRESDGLRKAAQYYVSDWGVRFRQQSTASQSGRAVTSSNNE